MDRLDRLRRVGAEHVGSRGFGSFGYGYPVESGDRATARVDEAGDVAASPAGPAATIPSGTGPGDGSGAGNGETIGTNIQVAGVDEPDVVKAVGTLVYSLRGDRLRITDTASRSVLSVTDLDQGDRKRRMADTSELLVSGDTAVVLGSESVRSEPLAGDPSASVSVEEYLTITQVDVGDPARPTVADRSRVEGHLVAARLVGDQVRLVTGWSMSDIGFVVPTSPASVPVALDTNRRTLAASQVSEWIPEWDSGGEATPVSSCEHVYLPDTFAGVSMTSMINFTANGTFAPQGASVLAPSDVVYSTADEVVVASSVWVDPADRGETFDDWTSAVHRFDVATDTPSYVASGQVEGSIGNQFNFGEVGDRLAVVASAGTPWQGDEGQIDLTTFETEGSSLVAAGTIEDLTEGIGGVSGVRFTATRAFVSSPTGNKLAVIDLIDLSDPDAPARTAVITLGGAATYIHPISPERVIALGSRLFRVPDRSDEFASAAHADLVDTTDPAAPEILGEWDVPYSSTPAATDHHAFLHWPSRDLMGFESQFDRRERDQPAPPPEATLVSTDPGLAPKASVRPQRVDPDPPCPTLDPEGFRAQLGDEVGSIVVLDCSSPRVPDYPGRSCSPGRTAEDKAREGLFFCWRNFTVEVVRVLVVDGAPWLYTSESLESLDPTSFASTGAVPLA